MSLLRVLCDNSLCSSVKCLLEGFAGFLSGLSVDLDEGKSLFVFWGSCSTSAFWL